MGWSSWHGALEHTLHRVAEERSGRRLVLLTGAAEIDDERRDRVLQDLKGVIDEAADGGVPLEQVHWWSAVDGYEAGLGFEVRTGLFDRDRNPTGIQSLALPKPETVAEDHDA
jgi:beta-glucosidase/6-phospho-beta-glucosidase/beta-galactosidase